MSSMMRMWNDFIGYNDGLMQKNTYCSDFTLP